MSNIRFTVHIKPEKFNDFKENFKLCEFVSVCQPKSKLKRKNLMHSSINCRKKIIILICNVVEFTIVFV